MKILMDSQPDGFAAMRKGLASAFEAGGHACYLYDIRSKAPLDAFYEIRPDLYIGAYNAHTMGVRKGIEKHKSKFFALEAVKPAFDNINLKRGTQLLSLKCDIAYIGRPVEGLLEILRPYKFKLFGDITWGVPQYLGNPTSNTTISDIYASCTLSPAFSPEEFFRTIGCGGFPFNPADGQNLDILMDSINLGDLNDLRENVYNNVLKNHTYVNRVAWILEKLKNAH